MAGYQKGQGIFYRPGDFLYEGNFDSVPHGNGVLYDLKNGFTYDGEFNHGKIEGQGKLTKDDNLYSYEGAINSDSQPTTGKLTVNHPQDHNKSYTVFLSNYPAMKARIEYQDGREYEGYLNLKTFLPEGEGTSKYPNDCIYEGEWLNGEFHGKGKFTWPNGS